MAVTQLRSLPSRRSAERQALAEAIERRTAALDAVKRINQAHEESTEVAYRASQALKVAEAAFVEAQADGDAHLAAAVLGELDGRPSAADIEAAVTQAANDLSIARRTRDALAQRAQREATEAEGAERQVEEAVRAVLASEASVTIDATLREAAALQDQLGAKRALLSFLRSSCSSVAAMPIRAFLEASQYPYEETINKARQHPACQPWADALKALGSDADTPLPI